MTSIRFKVHAIVQMEEREISIEQVRQALDNGEDIETRPRDHPYPGRLVHGYCPAGALHIAVRDNMADDETIVETVYWPDPLLWELGFKTRRRN